MYTFMISFHVNVLPQYISHMHTMHEKYVFDPPVYDSRSVSILGPYVLDARRFDLNCAYSVDAFALLLFNICL